MNNIKTKLHYYKINTETGEGMQEWKDVQEQALAQGHRIWNCEMLNGRYMKEPDDFRKMIARVGAAGGDIEIETAHLFSDQWNTAPIPGISENGIRVHGWFHWVFPNARIKEGYWIEITPELRHALDHTMKCGYCGKQQARKDDYTAIPDRFCGECLGSEYLDPDNLPLLRLRPVSAGHKYKTPELTAEEAAVLKPLYVHAQTVGKTERDKARIAKAREDVLKKYERETQAAAQEMAGMLFILDRAGYAYSNTIYYSHTKTFSIGWGNKVSSEVAAMLKEALAEFPFKLEVQAADGAGFKIEGQIAKGGDDE